MTSNPQETSISVLSSRSLIACWILLATWAISALTVAAAPMSPIAQALEPVIGIALTLFAITLAVAGLGWKTALLMGASAFTIALALENLSIATGVPFGFFTHTDAFGAKIGAVPFAVALGYFMLGLPAWLLTRVIIGERFSTLASPILAAFILTQFDLTHDPIGATVLSQWHFRYPSGLNGVPISNFLGWLVTSFAIFLVWSWLNNRARPLPDFANRGFWLLPIAFWAMTAAQYPLLFVTAPTGTVETGDAVIAVADVYETATINALLVMGFVVLLALARLFSLDAETENTDTL